MAAYPSFPVMRDGSSWTFDSGIQPARATNGVLKVRRQYSADKAGGSIVHWLSDSEKATLDSHYAAHRAVSFAFTWPGNGTTYTVVYAGAPQYQPQWGYHVATVPLLEV